MTKARKVHHEDSKMGDLLKDRDLDIREFKPGDLVEGVVVSSTHREILVDVGSKSEGVISGSDLSDLEISHKDFEVGDTLTAKVIQSENAQGYVVLSLKKAEKDKKWTEAEKALESGEVLEAVVIEYNKGGLLCDCLNLRGFVPLSHLDRVHFANDVAKFAAGSEAELKESLKVLSGTILRVKVIELNKEKNRFVLSEKEALSTYSVEARKKRLDEIKPESVVKGIVTGIMPFGIFVDLKGIEGLVHISEIAWEKVSHPSEYFKVGEKIKVMVLGIDTDSKKLALSVKRLTPNPWETVEEKYPVGTKVKGEVSKIVPFGAFVTIEKGLDGLIHISEAAEPLKEGDKVKAVVIQVDGSSQKLALTTKESSDPSTSSGQDQDKKSSKEKGKKTASAKIVSEKTTKGKDKETAFAETASASSKEKAEESKKAKKKATKKSPTKKSKKKKE